VDNRDEQGARFYAVIGRIYSRPEIRLRLGVYGDFVDLPAAALFEGLGPFTDAGLSNRAAVESFIDEEYGR
jgi:hypothetical protein